MNKLRSFIGKKQMPILLTVVFLFLILDIIFLGFKWEKPAETYKDNVIIEFLVGSTVSIIPVFFAFYYGRKIRKADFEEKATDFLKNVRKLRETNPKKIDGEEAQRLVIDFSKTVSGELLQASWHVKLAEKSIGKMQRDGNCGVCGKKYYLVHGRCGNCKLDCFAWEEFKTDTPRGIL